MWRTGWHGKTDGRRWDEAEPSRVFDRKRTHESKLCYGPNDGSVELMHARRYLFNTSALPL